MQTYRIKERKTPEGILAEFPEEIQNVIQIVKDEFRKYYTMNPSVFVKTGRVLGRKEVKAIEVWCYENVGIDDAIEKSFRLLIKGNTLVGFKRNWGILKATFTDICIRIAQETPFSFLIKGSTVQVRQKK